MVLAIGRFLARWIHSNQVPSSVLALTSLPELSAHEPLLSNTLTNPGISKNRALLLSLAKWILKFSICSIFLIWVVLIFFFRAEFVTHLYSKWNKTTENSIFGITGSIFLFSSGPILLIALLSYLYRIIFPRENFGERSCKSPIFCLWTFPVLVGRPFGVVSAAEFIGILLFCIYVLRSVVSYPIEDFISIHKRPSQIMDLSFLMISIGLWSGSTGLYCLAFLFLPVSRGSILLRLIDIPFDHAIRYHIWLGHFTMGIFTLHGVCYMIAWAMEGNLIQEMFDWKSIGIAVFPGVISLLAGLLMWFCSLRPVRKNYFEIFFYTHQFYVAFIIFLAMHVGDFIFGIVSAGIFLFVLDRFLRFCQSQKTVDVISAAWHPCDTIELILSKPSNLRYNALSFIFLQVQELSSFQWHPFSVSSSPLEGRNHLSILIKVLGEWTENLRNLITNVQEQPEMISDFKPSKITVSMEGPYGHEISYHLMYENLILVAGGIGISPFLAILSDILHLIKNKSPCLPRNVLVIWAVRKSAELSLISVVDLQSICTHFSDELHIKIHTYVTQESECSLEEGSVPEKTKVPFFPVANEGSMPCLVSTGNNVWSAVYFVISFAGFVIVFGSLEVYYIKPLGVSSWWYRGLLFILCMIASVAIFGGCIAFLWHRWEERKLVRDHFADNGTNNFESPSSEMWHADSAGLSLRNLMTIQYGCKPVFHEILESFSKPLGHANVGVIACGPPALQSGVANECRSRNLMRMISEQKVFFHFHSHSFDL